MPEASVVAERLRSQLWPIPAVAALVAGLVALALARVRPQPGAGQAWWSGEASSARGLLEVLAGSSLTVVALVFSLQVVALQLAASQYSPRVLRTYARDPWIQGSLAVLIATFVYCLVTLALFGTASGPPGVSVTLAVLLALASVAALLGVVSHIVSSLRVETMMAEIHADAVAVIVASLGAADVADRPDGWPPASGAEGSVIRSPGGGFVQAVDRNRLLRWAAERDVRVLIEATPGSQVLAGRAIGRVWPAVDDTAGAVECVVVGHERTPDEDAGFGLVQLVDIAARALSPSVNDPTTAVHAIAHLAGLAGRVADHRASGGDHCVVDEQGAVRVVVALPRAEDLMTSICRPVVRSGAGHPEALLGVVSLLDHVVERDPALRRAAREEARYVARAAQRSLDDPLDRDSVLTAAAALLDERGIVG